MKRRLNDTQKRELVEQYQNGTTAAVICIEAGIPKSTLYSWLKLHRSTITRTGTIVTPREFDNLKKRVEKLENIVKVLKTVNYTTSSDLQDKLYELELLYEQFSVHVLCEALDVSRGTFYNHLFRNKRDNTSYTRRREELREVIQEVYNKSWQLFGANKIRAVLIDRGYVVSDKMVSELMREMGLYSIRTTAKRDYKRNRYENKTNVLKQNFHADKPNQVWVGDVTYFQSKEKHYYICVILDLYSRKAIAYRVSCRNSTRLVTSTLKQAYAQRKPTERLTFHSDRGTPYTSYSYCKLLQDHNIEQSFSNSGKPHDNAVAESFFSSMKQEWLYRGDYRSEREFRKGVDDFILFYNTQRPHAAINYKTPDKIEKMLLNRENSRDEIVQEGSEV